MMENLPVRRREFVQTVLSLLATPVLSQTSRSAPKPAEKLTAVMFQDSLVGPILSVPTCYQADLSLDFAAMTRIVDLGLRSGCRLVTLTAGNNQYDLLSQEEIRELTRQLIEVVKGRAVMIAATGKWDTATAVAYAKFAQKIGADALQVTLPSHDEAPLLRHFEAITEAVPLPIVLHGDPPIPVLERLMKFPSIVAFKEEYSTIYSLQIYRAIGQRLTLFAGGEKARLLTYYPYGMRAWYSTFMTFAPSVALQFQQAIQNENLSRAGELVLQYETPVFARWSHAFWRATLEHFRLASRWIRGPEIPFTNEQMSEVARFYESLGLNSE